MPASRYTLFERPIVVGAISLLVAVQCIGSVLRLKDEPEDEDEEETTVIYTLSPLHPKLREKHLNDHLFYNST